MVVILTSKARDPEWSRAHGFRFLARGDEAGRQAISDVIEFALRCEAKRRPLQDEVLDSDELMSALLTQGRFAEAEALIVEGGEFATPRVRANLADARGDRERAERLYSEAVATGDKFAAVDWGVSVIDCGVTPSDELISSLTAALEWDPMAYRLLSDHVRRDEGDLQRAVELAEEGIEAGAANSLLALGWCFYDAGDKVRALAGAMDALEHEIFGAEHLLSWSVEATYGVKAARDLVESIAPMIDQRLLAALRNGLDD